MKYFSEQKTRQPGSFYFPEQHPGSALTSVHISKQALEHNIKQYRSVIGATVRLAPVIKSNAYGHGLLLVAQIYEQNADVDMLCVVALSEAITLREHGITKPILVLSIIDDALEHIVTYNIEVVLYDLRIAQALNTIAQTAQKMVNVHLKVDTGLSRLGILWNMLEPFAQQLLSLSCLQPQGIFTHFAESENKDQTFTNLQLQRFEFALSTLESLGISIPFRHTSCSAALTISDACHYNVARLGIGSYGLWPSAHNKTVAQAKYPNLSLIPALTWKTTIIQVKTVPSDSSIGYDRTFRTSRQMRIAILPLGYWDGVARHLSNKGHVLIHNILAPIVGRIAMNMMMVDITEITHVQTGDTATILGNSPGITAEDIALLSGTINYEVVTRINPLLPRFII